MERTEVKFTVKSGGEIKMDVVNGTGENCVVATQELEVSLANAGSKQKDEGKKPEYYGGGSTTVFNDLTGGE
ncbi:DUF2997 domain-containing protein [Bacillus atrophaeus]|uniref:DUF2997 domain-containing protein n=1 Tax=Bacillus atrophaeus TaxID=1452 RepID=UPI001C10E680|nr:DUF2997 domain-containing protein [Bacillus atrophaeus]MBU5262021.1 DUF2997 domain-containing protein [Bacillus atrophaeus]MCY8466453.1 DUF2997 domain-containing protein [Bacillus atrophaeus]MCY8478912.1 DUF2997 domain-containing protein [Bacillus atrophaeus]